MLGCTRAYIGFPAIAYKGSEPAHSRNVVNNKVAKFMIVTHELKSTRVKS
jgi:hypothetical protein